MKIIHSDLESSHVPLKIEGNIPEWLEGTLVRNGPLDVAVKGEVPAHWFDGLAMLHAFTLEKGGVRYSNRFLRTEAYRSVFEKKSLAYDGFAVDPCRSLFKRLFTWFSPRRVLHNANINVARIAGEYVALTETPLPVRFDPLTLETLGVLDYQDHLPHGGCWESAHPHFEGANALNYLIEYGKESYYTIYKANAHREVIARIPTQEPAYMHSFALTERFVILTEFPLVVKPLDFLTKGKPFIHNFVWKPERGTRFIVIDKATGNVVVQPTTKPFFAFHHANAYEEGHHLILDIVCYDDPSVIFDEADYFRPTSLQQTPPVRMERFSLSLESDSLTAETIFDGSVEFPRINSSYDGLPYQYLYLADPQDKPGRRPLYKFDTKTRQTLEWAEEGCFPGEPVFVASPDPKAEDDGVILAIVHSTEPSFLLVLDARTFEPLAKAFAPHPIAAGLHNQFFN